MMPKIRDVPQYTEATAGDAETLLNALDDEPRHHLEVMASLGWSGDRFYCAMNLLLGARLAEMELIDSDLVKQLRKRGELAETEYILGQRSVYVRRTSAEIPL